MPGYSIIDSLIVEIGLDPAKYNAGRKSIEADNKGLREDAKKTADELESRGSQAAAFFGQIQNKVLGLIASYAGFSAIKSEMVEVTNATAALGRAAAVTGARIEDLDAFGRVIKRNGGDAAAATNQVKGFIQAIERFKVLGEASPQLQMFLGTIGANQNDTWLEDLKKFADFADRNKRDPALVSLIAAQGGITDDATISELMKGRRGFGNDLDRATALGLTEAKDAEAARQLQASFADLKQAVDAFTRDVVKDLTPALKGVIGALTGWFQHKSGPRVAGVGASVGFVAGGIVGGPLVGAPVGAVVGGGIGAFISAGADAKANRIRSSIAQYGGYFDDDDRWVEASSPAGHTGSAPVHGAGGTKARPGGGGLLPLFRRLESSGDQAISPKGAIGRYQITPDTARTYGFDPGRLKDPAYNEMAASVILSKLSARYGGDLDAIAIAYHSGPGAADKFLASNRDDSVLGPQGRAYLAHERRLTGGDGGGNVTTIGTIIVQTQATDASGIAKGIRGALSQNQIANQANAGLQ